MRAAARARITPAYAGKSSPVMSFLVTCRDHPRLCGEKPVCTGDLKAAGGSPPPMRGKGFQGQLVVLAIGITPAYAGKSDKMYQESQQYQDHPRLCGEKVSTVPTPAVLSGSPPPMRGKVQICPFADLTNGITPAYAGKRYHQGIHQQDGQDHPRLCGEKGILTVAVVTKPGSPPPMRGKDDLSGFVNEDQGITPAYAGKSQSVHGAGGADQDHPRLCGEKHPFNFIAKEPLGSPPPMRGKVLSDHANEGNGRITPAYAGKRRHAGRNGDYCKDHPRLCGEKIVDLAGFADGEGSPPPMRGKVKLPAPCIPMPRITPAYAGKRAVCLWHCVGKKDHPRLCGEKFRWG